MVHAKRQEWLYPATISDGGRLNDWYAVDCETLQAHEEPPSQTSRQTWKTWRMDLRVLRTVVSLSSTVWQVGGRSILVGGKGKVVERLERVTIIRRTAKAMTMTMPSALLFPSVLRRPSVMYLLLCRASYLEHKYVVVV